MSRRRAQLRPLLTIAGTLLLSFSIWFSASAVLPQLTAEWGLTTADKSWMTMAVQLGFVVGALLSAFTNLPDRMPAQVLVGLSCLLGAIANAGIALWSDGVSSAIALRFVTGASLAGIYPPAMKLAATWSKASRGLAIGLLVAGLTQGKALPHLVNGLVGSDGLPPWRDVLLVSSTLAALAGAIAFGAIRPGPYAAATAPFDWRYAVRALSHRPTRLANFGYLGHMWELYAMWAWVPIFLLASFDAAGGDPRHARFAGYAALGAGSLGSILAGVLADRMGRTVVAGASLVVSGLCCLVVGLLFESPWILSVVCVIWGFAVVADSAQFSAAVSELSDPRYVGTALTVQTCLGFLLTMVTLWAVPEAAARWGWDWVFVGLALGPVFGVVSMVQLRRHPESVAMASGHR